MSLHQNSPSQKIINVRAAAAQVLFEVVDQGQSLSNALPKAQQSIRPRDHGLLMEMCYGALRYLPRLESISSKLMDKPLKGKQRLFHHLILIGLYQMSEMRIPAHAAVGETVAAMKDLKALRLKGLINAVLRNYQRNQADLDAYAISHSAGKYAHPSWLLKRLQQDHPNHWQDIVSANNQKAPMWLRVNRQHHDRDQYLELLTQAGIEAEIHPQAPDALKLNSPMDVYSLPGFEQGWVSVQDAAAQLSVEYLQPQVGDMILDCCAAPGGKTAHILERLNSQFEKNNADKSKACEVVAMDCDPNRLTRVEDNLQRLNLDAQVICGDARYPEQWWDKNKQFDRILLDAPCSATGVIRRHPDIKWLRRDSDIHQLAELQSEIIDAMWTLLKPQGTLLYATCSILAQENHQQIKAFLARTPDAKLVPIQGHENDIGRQIISGQNDMDGFYYCVLVKG